MKRRASAAILLLLVQLIGCRQENPSRPAGGAAAQKLLSFATEKEGPLENALRDFDSVSARNDAASCREAGSRVLEAARSARDELEKHPVPEALEPARREELVFLNHVIPGFQAFLSGNAGSDEIRKLRQILVRGRSHQKRARAWLEKSP